MNYDSWLEKPYADAAERSEEYERFCESYDLDPDEDNEREFEDYLDAMNEPDPDDARDAWLDARDYDD